MAEIRRDVAPSRMTVERFHEFHRSHSNRLHIGQSRFLRRDANSVCERRYASAVYARGAAGDRAMVGGAPGAPRRALALRLAGKPRRGHLSGEPDVHDFAEAVIVARPSGPEIHRSRQVPSSAAFSAKGCPSKSGLSARNENAFGAAPRIEAANSINRVACSGP